MLRFLKNFFHLIFALLACLYYRFPGKKMTVIGITGTAGKTTTAHLIYEILKKADLQVSMISTIEAKINGVSYDTGFHVTTPSPWVLQKMMRRAVNCGNKYFVLEVTSHALDQNRIFGTSIDIAVVTNISHEHLDYHETFDNYRATKAKILRNVKYSILPADDCNFNFLQKKAGGKILTFAVKNKADYTCKNTRIKLNLIGEYNLYNSLAAYAVADIVGIKREVILKALSQFKGLVGRMEEVANNRGFRIFIDFAHKPDALNKALKTGRSLTKNKLIVIFGCAGLRDKLKRPIMGRIAAKLADYTILTAEDPRLEDVRDIIEQIAVGCRKEGIEEMSKRDKKLSLLERKKKYFWRIPDRQEAINFAIKYLAKRGDLILVCGKGHEKSMCYGKTEYPWDEKKAIMKALYGTIKPSS